MQFLQRFYLCMSNLIIPQNLQHHATAFFTGRSQSTDLADIAKICGTSENHVYLPIQKHTDTVLIIDSLPEPSIADAVVTDRKGLVIGVRVADCVPILLCDPEKHVVGTVHAGWRGTAQEILKKTITVFSERYGCNPASILIAIGPSIRQCCYEVDPEVFNAVSGTTDNGDYFRKKGEKYHIDLAQLNRLQALGAGAVSANIWISDDCTFCNPEKFHSYRFSGGSTGRQAGFIGII